MGRLKVGNAKMKALLANSKTGKILRPVQCSMVLKLRSVFITSSVLSSWQGNVIGLLKTEQKCSIFNNANSQINKYKKSKVRIFSLKPYSV
jgi:hypothetical protein